jgi:branched-chain amino acid transport system ATP-binding protein
MTEPLLKLENVSVRFGGLTAVSEFSLEIGNCEIVGLIGPNGAGKTTVFNLVTGVYKPTEGEIYFAGEATDGLAAHEITRLGIARTFQNIRLFPSLSVFDNARVATNLHLKHGIGHALVRGPVFRKEEREISAQLVKLLDLFELTDKQASLACELPYGDQRRLEIVRALATRPRLLLLDEPAAGMNPAEKEELMRLIRFIHESFQISILLVEHDMKVVMGICQRITVLNYGKKIAEGTPTAIRNNSEVIEAYLGEAPTNAPAGEEIRP